MTSTIASNGAPDVIETKGKAPPDVPNDLKLNGTAEDGEEEETMECDAAPESNGEKNQNGGGEDEEEGEDEDDLSSDIGLIEDEEDIDDLAPPGKDSKENAETRLDEDDDDVEMVDGEEKETREKSSTKEPSRSESRQSALSDASVEEIAEPEIVEHVVRLVVSQLVNVVTLKASAYNGTNTLKRRREMETEEDLIDEIEDGDIESRIKCVDILHNRHEQIRLKREQR